jgi:hypothetical protein
MLMDHAHTEVNCIVWRMNDNWLTVNYDLALVWAVQAVKDVHERGLACAILAQ